MPPSIPPAAVADLGHRPRNCCQALLRSKAPDVEAICEVCGIWWSPTLPQVGCLAEDLGEAPAAPANDTRPQGHVDVVTDCETLARWLPVILGRSTQREPEGGGGAPRNHGERADSVDERHRDRRHGLRRALVTLQRLDLLERLGHHRAWRVLWLAYVRCGPLYRLQLQPTGGLAGFVARTFASEKRRTHWNELKQKAVLAHQVEVFGVALLTEAHERYEDAARGILRPRTTEPPAAHPVTVGRHLDELFDRRTRSGSKRQ